MTYKEAVNILRFAVKESHLEEQRHIDLSVVTADKRKEAQEALMWVRTFVARGEISEEELKRDLGIDNATV